MSKKIFFSVEEILSDIYFDEIEEAINKLKDYNLLEEVDKKLRFLESQIEQKRKLNLNVFAISFLQSINTNVLNIQNIEDKEFLKCILSDIGTYLIDVFIMEGTINVHGLKDLEGSLKSISEIEGYNYRDLEKHIQLRRAINNQSSMNNQYEIKTTKLVYYDWTTDDYILNEIAGNLKSEESISCAITFKKLFSDKPKKVSINRKSKDFIVVLFDVLHKKGLIKPRGNKGHFIPLSRYAVDFENNLLFNKAMKQEKYTIKKNESKYIALKRKAEKWIS